MDQKIAQAGRRLIDKEQEETRRLEAIRAKWAKWLSRPADEYIAGMLVKADLPSDVREVINRTCSFWACEESSFWGEPICAIIERVSCEGDFLYLHLRGGSYVLIRDGIWTTYRGSCAYKVSQFRLMSQQQSPLPPA